MFSKACQYALRSVIYITIKSVRGSRLGIPEIAKEIDAPVAFTAKILQTLAREKVVSSIKGPNGGFFIDPLAKPVFLNDIVRVIDGEDVLRNCALGLTECSDRLPCPIHQEIKHYKERLRTIMKTTTVNDLAEELNEGKTFLRQNRSKPLSRLQRH